MNNSINKEAAVLDLLTPESLALIAKGALTGSLGFLGVRAASDLISAGFDKFFGRPKLPQKIYIDIPEEKEELEKESNDFSIGKAMLFGMGLPLGIYGAYQLENYLNAANMNLEYIKKLNELEEEYEKKYSLEDKHKIAKAYYKGFSDGTKKIVKEAQKNVPQKYPGAYLIPLMWGASIPLGFLAGYYGLKSYLPDVEEELELKEIEPEIKIRTTSKKKKKGREKQAQVSSEQNKTISQAQAAEAVSKEMNHWYNYLPGFFSKPIDFLYEGVYIPPETKAILNGLALTGSLYLLWKSKDLLAHSLGIKKSKL